MESDNTRADPLHEFYTDRSNMLVVQRLDVNEQPIFERGHRPRMSCPGGTLIETLEFENRTRTAIKRGFQTRAAETNLGKPLSDVEVCSSTVSLNLKTRIN